MKRSLSRSSMYAGCGLTALSTSRMSVLSTSSLSSSIISTNSYKYNSIFQTTPSQSYHTSRFLNSEAESAKPSETETAAPPQGDPQKKQDGFTLTDEQKELARKLFKTPVVENWESYQYDPVVVDVVNKIIRFDAMQLVEITKLLQFKLKIDETTLFKSFAPMASTLGYVPYSMAGMGMPMQGGAAPAQPQVDPKKQQLMEEAKKKAEEDKKKVDEEKERIKMANQTYMATLTAVDEASKFKVLKEIRKIIPGMKLLESKEMVDKLPSKIKEVNKEDGDKMVALFKELGGTLELKVK